MRLRSLNLSTLLVLLHQPSCLVALTTRRGALNISDVAPSPRTHPMASYISRSRFRSRLCPTTKGVPVSGQGYVSVLQMHKPTRAPHFRGWRQTYKGVGRGGDIFCPLDLPLLLPAKLHTSDLQKTGFPFEGGFFNLVSKTC